MEILKKIGFNEGSVLCFHIKEGPKIGDPVAIDEAMELLQKNGLVLKIVNKLQHYLSYETRFSEDKKKTWLGQPYLFENPEKKLEIDLQEFKVSKLQVHQSFQS